MASKRFSIEAIFKATDHLSAPIAKMRTRLMGFGADASKGLRTLDERLGKIRSGLTKVATAAAAVGTVGGLAAFSIGKTGAEFEQAITAVGAVSLQTRDQIADLEAEAKRLGATTKFTATQAANAMETMSRAGFTNAEILQGVGAVLSGAAAEGIEIEEMANHVSNALKGMGLETTETARVADVLALASARTNSSIASLGESLANVASTARQFKIPLEDTVGAVALLQDVGLDASVAGSALNVMLTQMAAPTDSIKEKMRQFGVTFKDAKGNMLPFQDVLKNISIAAKKSGGNMDQVAFMAELVGLRGQKAAANLKDLFDSGKVQDLTRELQGAEGAAAKMAAIRMDNTIGDLTTLASAIDAVKIELFQTQSGPLREIIQSMTKWVQANQDLIVFEFQVWIRWLRNNLPEIVTWLKRIGAALVAFYALSTVVKTITGIASAISALKAAWVLLAPLLANPWGLAAIAIAGVVVAVIAFWPEIKAFAVRVGEVATAVAEAVVGLFQTMFPALVATVRFVASVATSVIGGAVELLKSYWTGLGEVFSAVAGVFKSVWGAVFSWFADKIRLIVDPAMGVINKLRSAGRAVIGSGEREGPQVVTPQERAALEAQAVSQVNGAIRVEAAPGTKAQVTAQPRHVKLDLQPSGAFA